MFPVRVNSVFEFKGPELIECRLFVNHKSMWGLYYVDMNLGEFSLHPQTLQTAKETNCKRIGKIYCLFLLKVPVDYGRPMKPFFIEILNFWA